MTELKNFIRPEFQEYFRKFDLDLLWKTLSKCEFDFAEELLLQNPDKIDWSYLSQNSTEWAGKILLENPEKIKWAELSTNTSVNQSSPTDPVIIVDGNELIYFMNTTAIYANITNSIVITEDLIATTYKTLVGDNISITKTNT